MSRRFWLGTPKGQYTSAITSFLTSRLTNTSFSTSAITLVPTTFITQWYTPTPTSNLTTTTYPTLFTDPGIDTEYSSSFVTNYITNWVYPVSTAFGENTIFTPTDNQTFKGNYNTNISTNLTPTPTVYTSYTPVSTNYQVLTPTPTNYTYFYTYDTLYSQNTTSPTVYTSYEYSTNFRDTGYDVNTTVTGYFVTTYETSTTNYNYPASQSGCYYYNVDGSPAGQDSIPSNCSIVSCSPGVPYPATGQLLTAYSYSQPTFYVSNYISSVTSYSTTFTNTFVGNGLGAPPFSGCYPEIDAAEYCANPESNCFPCAIYEQTAYINTTISNQSFSTTVYYNSGYILNQYTTVSYVERICQDCTLSCNTTEEVIDANPTGAYVPPSSRVTGYIQQTAVSVDTIEVLTPGTTTYPTSYYVPTQGEGYITQVTNYTSNTSVPTQYTNLTPGTTQYTSFSTTLNSILETTSYLTESGVNTLFRDTDYATSNPTSRTTTTTYLQNTGATSYEVPTSHETTTTYDTDYLTQRETSRDTEVITSWLTDDNVTTSFTTSRSTTWFTQ